MPRKRTPPERDASLAVTLTRVSTDEQVGALTGQRDEILRYALAKGIIVEREFEDAGESGRDGDRPGLRAAIDYLKAPGCGVGTLLILHASRLMRDLLKYMLLKRELGELGVRILAVQHAFDDDPMGRLLEQFVAGVAEMESTENARRTRNGMRSAAIRGSCPAAIAPLGYKLQTAADGRRVLVIDEGEAPTIRELFAVYSRRGAVGTAAELNGRRLHLRGTGWSRERVLRVLADRTYVGEFVWGRRGRAPVVLSVEPIIGQDAYLRAEEERARRDPVRNPGRAGSSPLLLGGGIVRCGLCGSSFELQTSGKPTVDGSRREYMQCRRARRSGVESCRGRPLPVALFNAALTEAVVDAVCAPERCAKMLAEVGGREGPLARQASEEGKRREREARELERAQENLLRAVETGALPLAIVTARLRDLCERVGAAQAAAAQAETLNKSLDLADTAVVERFRQAVINRLRADHHGVRALIHGLIGRIVVNSDSVEMVPKNAPASEVT